jgi:hypothetical protein
MDSIMKNSVELAGRNTNYPELIWSILACVVADLLNKVGRLFSADIHFFIPSCEVLIAFINCKILPFCCFLALGCVRQTVGFPHSADVERGYSRWCLEEN